MSEAPSALACGATQRFDPSLTGVKLPDPVESFAPHFLPRREGTRLWRRYDRLALFVTTV